MTEVVTCSNQGEWDEYVDGNSGHPLQLWGWGEVKADHGWRAERVFVEEDGKKIGAAQVLLRSLPKPFNWLAYVPRGPIASKENRQTVLGALAGYVKATHGAVTLTIEPDWEEMPEVEGWRESTNTILIPRTLILDLSQEEDELLSHMASNTRYHIRKSIRDGVVTRRLVSKDDVAQIMEVYKETAQRASFSLHEDQYYYDIFEKMGEHTSVIAAYYEDKPVAFVWLAISKGVAFELYGGMSETGRRVRANYALKWDAIRTMKKWGIEHYDFNGLLNDGVSTFKQGFASHETMLAGTFDKPLSPLYFVWNKGLPLAKKLIRAVKK